MEPSDAVESALTHDIHVQATYRLTEALVSSEKRMRRRIELLSEVVFEADCGGRLSFLNRAWKDTLGYDPETSLGTPLRSYVAEEDRPVLDRTLASACRHGAGARPQIRMLHRNGGTVWMELSASSLDEGGVVGTLHDVTRQKLAQAELAMLSLVASYTDSLVLISDGDGYIEWVNEAFTRKTGYNMEESMGRKPGAFLQGPGTDPATVAFIHQRLVEGRSFQCEILNYTKSGQEYWVSIHVSPIRNALGQVERFVSIQTDITELRRTQQDLKAAKEAAESASEAKTQFLATISHEMRTPLNVVLGTAELALESASGPEQRHHLARINENAEALLGLISDLLDVSKIEAGQFEWEHVAFPLRNCLQQALAPIAERATLKGLQFRMLLDEKLPERIVGDPVRLRQIVVNLSENAVKFTESGFVRVEAITAKSADGNRTGLGILVSDSGIGIPEAVRPRVFDRFFQGDASTTRRKGGAGLGLSIVKSIVGAMGGRIGVTSRASGGAQFEVWLPLEPVAEPEKAAPREICAVNPDAASRNDAARILVAEDNDDNFAIVQRHLNNRGYRVERAVNGREASEVAARHRFDLILMDVEMPEMDGFEATRLIRDSEERNGLAAGGRRVPILALTAHAVKGYRERCLQSGCTGYLAKPVRKQTLLDAVADALTDSSAAGAQPGREDETAPWVDVDPELADLVPRFLENCRRDLALIREAIAAGDWNQAVRTGHGMKGSAPSYGFEEIGLLGKELEAASRARDGAAVQDAADRLAAYLLRLRVRYAATAPA